MSLFTALFYGRDQLLQYIDLYLVISISEGLNLADFILYVFFWFYQFSLTFEDALHLILQIIMDYNQIFIVC